MPLQQIIISETSPNAPGTAASSQPVSGSPSANLPNGVAGFLDDYDSVDVAAELRGATGGSLSVYLQLSSDLITWYDLVAWPVQSAAGPATIYRSPISQATNTSVPTVVGKNLSPALSNSGSGSVVNGAFNAAFRVAMVAGSGTTAGAPIIVRITGQRSRIREAGGA